MALELSALMLLQQKPQIKSVSSYRPVNYSYSVEASFYNPDWAFTLNFELLERGLFQIPLESQETVRFETSKVRLRQRSAARDGGRRSLLPDLSQEQFDEVFKADPSFITQFVLMPLGMYPSYVNTIVQFRSELPSRISILGETYLTSQISGESSFEATGAKSKVAFQMVSMRNPRMSYTATLDRRSDQQGKTLFADVTLTDDMKNWVTLRIQRVPTTP